jgi:hypothetical protein
MTSFNAPLDLAVAAAAVAGAERVPKARGAAKVRVAGSRVAKRDEAGSGDDVTDGSDSRIQRAAAACREGEGRERDGAPELWKEGEIEQRRRHRKNEIE